MINIGKYDFLKNIKGFTNLMSSISFLSCNHQIYMGITGSTHSLMVDSDIDIILIVPDDLFLNRLHVLSNDIVLDYGVQYSNLEKLTVIDVIGASCIDNNLLRLEIYKNSAANKLLDNLIFPINRLKKIFKDEKIEIFFNKHGNKIEIKLLKEDCISKTYSFITHKNHFFWGMHYERVLLSEQLIDTSDFYSKIINARKIFCRHYRDCNFNDCFYVSTNNNQVNINLLFNFKNND